MVQLKFHFIVGLDNITTTSYHFCFILNLVRPVESPFGAGNK